MLARVLARVRGVLACVARACSCVRAQELENPFCPNEELDANESGADFVTCSSISAKETFV